jgi:hypothetical protein
MEKVNPKMLERLVRDEDAVLVLFAKEDSKETETVLDDLERYVHKLERQGVGAVFSTTSGLATRVYGLPTSSTGLQLVLFEHGVPTVISEGPIIDPVHALNVVQDAVDRQEIPTIDSQVSDTLMHPSHLHDQQLTELEQVLSKCLNRIPDLVVLFFEANKKRHQDFIRQMEHIDDDAERLDIVMVKAEGRRVATDVGLAQLPAVVYYENGVPNVFAGELTREDVQHWFHEHRTGGHAVKVTGVMLESLVVVIFTYNACLGLLH